jgi:hypothetical protein
MTEKRILAIFKSVCVAQGRIIDPTVGEKWRAALMRFTREEVLEAIKAWRLTVEPAQGSLLAKRPRGGPLPTPAELWARILAERERAYQAGAQAQRRRDEIEEFWRIVDERGLTEQEIRDKWPSYVGTRPKPKNQEDAA